MYKSFGVDEYRSHHKIAKDYTIKGLIIVGTFHPGPYEQFREAITSIGVEAEYIKTLEGPYFEPILEIVINKKRYWFTIAYGGALLSEWVHLACLLGSKANILIGNCGGLLSEADSPDIIVPSYTYGNESTTRMYCSATDNKHYPSDKLNDELIGRLRQKHKVWHGPTTTCQAMMAETWEDINAWSNEGYYAVEMEASTVFAVSNHFNVESTALLVIGDNLVHEKTVMDTDYESGRETRHSVRKDIMIEVLQCMIGYK